MNRPRTADGTSHRPTADGTGRPRTADGTSHRRPGAVVPDRPGGVVRRARPVNRRRAAAFAALLALTALPGCGIQKTDVVEAGGAATVIVGPIPEERIVLYFLGPDGRSMPVARDPRNPDPFPASPSASGGSGAEHVPLDEFGPDYKIDPDQLFGSRPGTDKILAMLLAGPRRDETAAGITTALPPISAGAPHVAPDPNTAGAARRQFRLRAPFPVKELTEAAVRQLVCTTAYAEQSAGLVDVSVIGPDGNLPALRCDE
ncbi:hypothetical protein ACFC0N_05950 [Streptomyces zaomyceticus]|uniref:hypothetical protein n=1 Tax=Streptomyces zaomyceticus TaxID=68286 RepID=UPI0035E36CB7